MNEQAARIEQHTIYPIPAGERHGRARDLFTVWFGSNIMILTIVTGALATVQFQLSLIAAVFAILIGSYTGPMARALGRVDISWLVALAVVSPLFYVLAHRSGRARLSAGEVTPR